MAIKVLIVEDNPVARSFLCRVVRESFSDTIVISEAGDLESARRQIGIVNGQIAALPADQFKLFMVDLELPDGNGMELLTELATTRRRRSSPRCTPTTITCSRRCSAAPTATC